MKYKIEDYNNRHPVKGYAEHKDRLVGIAVRLPAPLFKAIAVKAHADCQPVSGYIRKLLVQMFYADQF